jgi:hypothetical protein
MSDSSTHQSPRLGLPYLQPSQAQKHVTHNEALQRLDALAQLTVLGFAADTPPIAPQAGDMHGLGSAPTGAWSGQADRLALWDGVAWHFIDPQEGWRAFDRNTGRARVFEAGGWRDELEELDNLDRVGIGAAADATNRLTVAAPASLFTHDGAGHQIKVNKAASADTASLLLQSNWTGHAEIGLTGDTALSVKLSADGSSWTRMIRADPVSQTFEVDATLTGTAVQSSPYDTTADRVLRTGAHGLGSHLSSLSGDLFVSGNRTGFYYPRPVSASGATDMPQDGNWNTLLLTRGADYAFALAVEQDDVDDTDVWWNTKHAGSVGAWRRMIDTGNLIGPVSQAAGLPTGAVIETGSNANGTYIRFADGTQICHYVSQTLLTDSHTMNGFWASVTTTWTYPAAFAATPTVLVSAQRDIGTHFHWAGIASGGWSQTQAALYLMAGTSTATGEIHATTHGRWY